VYVVVFLVIWHFINKYKFVLWEYVLFIGLGQALGDGGFFFIANPFALIMLPYVMISYHAMNIVPFLAIKDNLSPKSNSKLRFIIPPITLITTFRLMK